MTIMYIYLFLMDGWCIVRVSLSNLTINPIIHSAERERESNHVIMVRAAIWSTLMTTMYVRDNRGEMMLDEAIGNTSTVVDFGAGPTEGDGPGSHLRPLDERLGGLSLQLERRRKEKEESGVLRAGVVWPFKKNLALKDAGGRSKWANGPNYKIFKNLDTYLQEILKCVMICKLGVKLGTYL